MTELDEKTRRLQVMMADSEIGAVVLNAQHNFAWLTGGGSNGVDGSRESGVASLVVTRNGKRYVAASVIEIGRMIAEEVSETDFQPVDFAWQDDKADPSTILKKIRQVVGSEGALASDIPLFQDVPAVEGKIAPLRYSLTAEEVPRFRSLGRDASNAMERAARRAQPGETETQIAEILRQELAADGVTSVVTLVAADERIANFRHPVPTSKRWNHSLLLVTCARRKGLIASLSRIVSVGIPSDELRQRTEAAASVNAAMLDATRPGRTGSDVYRAAADAYARAGFAGEIDLHHQGGAAGYKTREWVAHPKSVEVIRENQAFAWNPSITGTKVEDTVLTNAAGVEVLTNADRFPRISTTIGGREYLSPDILSI